jgi:E3 ubiquitin ligase
MGMWVYDPVISMLVFGVLFALRLFAGQSARRVRPGEDDGERVLQKQHGIKRWAIGRVPDGEVGRVAGTVRAHQRRLLAPLTGRPCVYYEVIVEQVAASGLRLCFVECETVPFVLEDGSGCGIVEPRGAEVAAAFDHTEELTEYDQPTPEQAAMLARNSRRGERSSLRFREALIVEGERVTVVGTAFRRPDLQSPVEVDYRAAPPLGLRIVTTDTQPMSIASHYVS